MALSNSVIFTQDPHFPSFSGSSLKPLEQSGVRFRPVNLSTCQKKLKLAANKRLTVQASRDRGRTAAVFIGGFVLGGTILGTLCCVYAPQISRVLSGTDRKESMKLPEFINDEEKALEKTRKTLTEKIAQLNAAIDNVSEQLRANDRANGTAVGSGEVEAST